MSPLHLNLLGAFQATRDNTPLGFDTDKTRALLAYLAVEADRPHQRKFLAGLLWSDLPEDRALHSLRQALSALRRSLGEPPNGPTFLLIEREKVQLNPNSEIHLDVRTFERDVERAMQHYRSYRQHSQVDSRLNIRLLRRAVSLFRGSFLDQLYLSGSPLFDEWASLKREQLNQLMIRSVSVLADFFERRGDFSQARQYASQIISLAPWDESAQIQVIRLLALEGHWSAAQFQFRHLKHYLHEQLGVNPTRASVELYEAIRQSAFDNTPFQPIHPLLLHNLPLNGTPFFGREKELDTISEALANPATRILTITGPGGVGKTRLALEIAHLQCGVFRDGVYYFPLATVTSHELLPTVLADTLGLSISDGKAAIEQIHQFVRDKHMLWLLDNLEQILPLPADNLILRILNGAPGIFFLCTSRQRVNLQEECLFPVTGLPFPQNPDQLNHQHFSAVDLFSNRAQRIHPAFELNNSADIEAVVQICQAVEGFPLGVELAAAGLWTHSTTEIAANLGKSLHSLTSDAVNANDRHRSLLAAFQVSWEMLSHGERRLLTQLSVFRGGFEKTMATQWLEAPITLLASLLDKSLLYRDISGRYGMHETIRQFATDKLAENADQEIRVRQIHAAGFSTILHARLAELKGMAQPQALTDIAMEWENIRQAWSWLVMNGQTHAIISCAEAVFHFCNIRTRYQEGIDLFSKAIAGPNQAPDSLPILLTFQGALAFRAYQNDLSKLALDRAQTLFKDIDAPYYLGLCLVFSSGMASRQKNPTLARELCEQALSINSRINNEWGLAYAWYQMGVLENRLGQVEAAQHALQTSYQAARKIGDQRRQIGPLNMLGDLACQGGDYHQAQVYFEECLALSRKLEDRYNIALALGNLGTTYHQMGILDQARNYYEESLLISQESNDIAGEGLALVNLGELMMTQLEFSQAWDTFQKALSLANQAGDHWLSLTCWINLAETSIGLGDLGSSLTYLKKSLPSVAQARELALVLRNILLYGRVFLLLGQRQKGIDLLSIVYYHEASHDEHRLAALRALQEARVPVPNKAAYLIEDALDIIG